MSTKRVKGRKGPVLRPAPGSLLLLTLLWRRRWTFAVDVLLGASFFLVGMVPGLVAKEVFDRLGAGDGSSVAVLLLALLVLVKLVHVSLGIAWMALDTALRGALLALLRHRLFDRILSLPAARALPVPVGNALSRLTEDVRQVVETLCKRGGLMNLTSSLSFAAVAIVVMVNIDAKVTAYVLLPVLAVLLMSYLAGQRVTRFRTRSRESAGDVSAFMGDLFAAVQLVKLNGARERVVGRLTEMNTARRSAAVRDSVFFALLQSSSRFVLALGTGLILLVASDEMRSGAFSVGDLALFTYLLEEVGIGVSVLGDFLRQWRQSHVSADRLGALQQDEAPRQLATGPQPALRGPLPAVPVRSPEPSERLRSLELRGLSYRYGTGGAGVADVDLDLLPGTVTVLTGQVGAGKTTLVQCLLGMLPADSGSVCWNGADVTGRTGFLRPPRCAYMPQKPQVFSASLRENVLLGLPDDGTAERALQAAVMEEDVAAMPDGPDTLVGPQGHRLSGGQLQRLAAARMFARPADLLVVDDVSSALDEKTERLLWERTFAAVASGGPALLIVSNKPEPLRRADTVLLMADGRITASGTFREMLRDSADFRALHGDDGAV